MGKTITKNLDSDRPGFGLVKQAKNEGKKLGFDYTSLAINKKGISTTYSLTP
jgi:hypothetical protein